MPLLTSKQISGLIAQAKKSGLSPEEVEGVVMAVLQRASEQDGAGKLGLAIDLAEAKQSKTMRAFMGEMQVLRAQQMQRGADDIMGMTESEWAALFEDEPGDDASDG